MIRCAAPGCGNDEESGVSLFPLPKRVNLKRKWEANIGRSDLGPTSAICEAHFTEDDLAVRDGVKFMKAAAVPTVFESQSAGVESDPPIRRNNRKKRVPTKRANRRKLTSKPVAEEKVQKKKFASSREQAPEKQDEPHDESVDGLSDEEPKEQPPEKSQQKTNEPARTRNSEDTTRKPDFKLNGADERGHAIAEWYLLDIFEATRLISSNLKSGTLITDIFVANVEETIIDVITKLLQRVSSVLITSIEEEFNVRSDIRKILGQLDGDVPGAVQTLLEEDKEEINPSVVECKTEDPYEETLNHLDPWRDDQDVKVVEEVISPATEDCQFLLEHSYFKEGQANVNKAGEHKKEKTEKSKQELHCGFCNFKSFWKPKLRRHLHFKHLGGERSYSCPRCYYISPSEEGLQKHFRTHTGAKPFACSICSFCTANKSNLTRHMMIHTGQKPFQCSHCDKTFRQKVSLTTHIKSHMKKEKVENNVYVCGECGFVTIKRSEWAAHSNTHKEFTCGHCEFVCSKYADFKEHMQEHNGMPHICKICDHKCHNADELRIHTATHKAGLDISCNICGYRTTKRSYLNRHVNSHFSEKTFACTICFAKFRTNGQLNAHVRRHEIGPYCKM